MKITIEKSKPNKRIITLESDNRDDRDFLNTVVATFWEGGQLRAFPSGDTELLLSRASPRGRLKRKANPMTKTITELKAIAERATQGEWEVCPVAPGRIYPKGSHEGFNVGGGGKYITFNLSGNGASGEANATYIATFDPPTVLALLARIEELEEALARVRSNSSIPHRVKQICDEVLTQNQE